MERDKLIPWIVEIIEVINYYERVRKLYCDACASYYGIIEKKASKCPSLNCPKCSAELDSIILDAPIGFVKGEPTTLGQMAERNAKKMGKYGTQERDRKHKESEAHAAKTLKRPDKAKVERMNKLAKMSNKQKEKYINTGEGL